MCFETWRDMQFLLLAWTMEEAALPAIEHQPDHWDHHHHQIFFFIVVDIIKVKVIIIVNTIIFIGEIIMGDIIIVVIMTDLLHQSGKSWSLVCAGHKEMVWTKAMEGKIHLIDNDY